MNNIIKPLTDIIDERVRTELHYGVVQSIEAYSVTVTISGAAETISGVKYVRSYVPRVNDTVLISFSKGDPVIIDALAAQNGALATTAHLTVVQTVTLNTLTNMTFGAVTNDSRSMWAAGDPTKLTAKVPGYYVATASVLLEGANCSSELSIWFSNLKEIGRQDVTVSKGIVEAFHGMVTTVPFYMAIGDYIQARIEHDHNPDLDLLLSVDGKDHTGFFNALSVIYVGP